MKLRTAPLFVTLLGVAGCKSSVGVPVSIISPYAKARHVEQNFGLGTLRTSDAAANSIEDAFDFHQRPIVVAVFALAGSNNSGNLYAHSSSLNDITTGNNGSCGLGSSNGIAAF